MSQKSYDLERIRRIITTAEQLNALIAEARESGLTVEQKMNWKGGMPYPNKRIDFRIQRIIDYHVPITKETENDADGAGPEV